MKNTIKVIKKCSNQVAVVIEIEDSLEAMRNTVEGPLSVTRINEEIDLWYNDEFLFHDFKPNLLLDSVVYHGSIFFASHNDLGDTVSLTDQNVDYIMNRFYQTNLSPITAFFNFEDSILTILKERLNNMVNTSDMAGDIHE